MEGMPRPRLIGVFVKTLFTLLRLLNVPQTAVRQRLGVAKPTVSAWATGTRALPPRYHRRFFAFVAHRLDDAMPRQHTYKAAAKTILRHLDEGSSMPRAILSLDQQEALSRVVGPVPDTITPEWAERWAIGHALWWSESQDAQRLHLIEQVIRLLDEWWLETQHVELYRELWDQCGLVVAYGALDFDAFWQRVRGSAQERDALQRAATTLLTRARRLNRVVVPLGVEPLLARRETWQALITDPRASTEPRDIY
jgi:hypothetical protein